MDCMDMGISSCNLEADKRMVIKESKGIFLGLHNKSMSLLAHKSVVYRQVVR